MAVIVNSNTALLPFTRHVLMHVERARLAEEAYNTTKYEHDRVDPKLKAFAIVEYRAGVHVKILAKKYGVHADTVYRWVRDKDRGNDIKR